MHNAPHLIVRCLGGLEQGFQRLVAQRANHEEITIAITQVQRCQIGIVLEGLAERFEQCQALFQVRRLTRRVGREQAQQVTNRLISGVQVQPDILLDAIEEFFTAGKDDLCGLPITEDAQHHPGQQQQEGEHHADMDVQRKPAWVRVQWARHCRFSRRVNALLSDQA
ncbi:hypothetical protein D3C85_1449470 [compost metagenome]